MDDVTYAQLLVHMERVREGAERLNSGMAALVERMQRVERDVADLHAKLRRTSQDLDWRLDQLKPLALDR